MIILAPYLFIFGIVIGSFLNVLALRYPEEGNFNFKTIGGRSYCPHCRKTLRWYELIPVFSFLVQKGKCRSCEAKISWQYPLVEIITGLIFLLPLYLYNPSLSTFYFLLSSIVWLLIFIVFLLIFLIDYRLYIIPNGLNLALVVLGVAKIYLGSGFNGDVWFLHLLGAIIGSAFIGLIILFTRGKGMGLGDLKLMPGLGLIFGWPEILFILGLGSVIGSLTGLLLMAFGKKNMKSHLPFGPFLIIGSVALFFFGGQILTWYFNLL